MKITVSKFRKCNTGTYEFPKNQTTLITGFSGIGKTTILRAIAWCMYGKCRKVAPKGFPNAKTSVSIVFSDGFEITRKRKPNLLTANSYIDNEAQALIDRKFGSHDVWNATSYAQQRQLSSFLLSSSTEKLNILNMMAFGFATPREYILKLHNLIKVAEAKHEKQNQCVESNLAEYIKLSGKLDTKYIVEFDIDEEKLHEYSLKILQLESIEKSISGYMKEFEALKCPIEPILEEIPEILDILGVIEKRKLSSQIVSKTSETTEEELVSVKSLEKEREKNLSLSKELKIEYDEDIINREISRLTEIIEAQPYLKNIKLLNIIEEKLRKYTTECPVPIAEHTSKQELQELEKETAILSQQLSISKKALKCPCCSAVLHYNNGKLTELQSDPVRLLQQISSNNTKITRLSALLDRIQQYQVQFSKYESEKKEREILLTERKKIQEENTLEVKNIPLLSEREVSQAITRRVKLESIKVIRIPVSSKEIETNLKISRENQRIKALINNQKLYHEYSIEELTKFHRIMKENERKRLDFVKNQELYNSKRESLVSIINSLASKLDLQYTTEICIEISNKLLETRKQKVLLELQRENTLLSRRIEEMYSLLCNEKEKLEEIIQELEDLYLLHRLTIETEQKLLLHVISSINKSVSNICSNIFYSDIAISLQLYESPTKRDVLLHIDLDGNEYDDWTELSPGEQDRVTLAMTLALNMMWHCPFLLVDEPFSQLDEETHERVITILKETENKTVLCVSHNIVTGLFDNVLRLQ